MNEPKIIGTAYVKVIKDERGEIKFVYGYETDQNEISLNDLAMLNSFLDKIKKMAQEDFEGRLEINDKEFSVEKNEDKEI